MTQDRKSMKSPMRLLLASAGMLITVIGALGAFSTTQFFFSTPTDAVTGITTSRDMIFMALLGIVALCFISTGISLLIAAWKKKMHDVVPGPTIYILGVSLVATAMLFFSVSAYLPGALLAVVGFYAMWIEYRSAFI